MSRRSLRWGFFGIAIAVVVSTVAAWTIEYRYSGANIRIRPWMLMTASGVAGLHLLALAAMTWVVRRSGRARFYWGAVTALALLALVLPWVIGEGPWAPDSIQIRTLRITALTPSIARDLALFGLAGSLLKSPLMQITQVAFLGSVAISFWVLFNPHSPILPQAHALELYLPGLALWAVGLGLFGYGVKPR